MIVEKIVEHKDGSATITLIMSKEEQRRLLEVAMVTLINKKCEEDCE